MKTDKNSLKFQSRFMNRPPSSRPPYLQSTKKPESQGRTSSYATSIMQPPKKIHVEGYYRVFKVRRSLRCRKSARQVDSSANPKAFEVQHDHRIKPLMIYVRSTCTLLVGYHSKLGRWLQMQPKAKGETANEIVNNTKSTSYDGTQLVVASS